MSKRSRRPSRADAAPQERSARSAPSTSQARSGGSAGTSGADAGRTGRGSYGPSGTSRAGRRERDRRLVPERSFLDRYRIPLAGISAVVIVGALLFVFYSQATAKSYICDSLMTPAPSAAPGASPEIGQIEADMGQVHVPPGTTEHYGACPPASGPHYNAAGLGPIDARFYASNETVVPQSWIHNLEHGAIVIAYSCTKGSCDDASTQQLRDLLTGWPNSPICGIPPLTSANVPTPVIVRFDDMSTPYAAIVWDRVLLLNTLNRSQILAFYQRWGDLTNPERLNCPLPSGSPAAASASPGPSGSAAPSASAASPAASPAPSAAASPAASVAPSASASPS